MSTLPQRLAMLYKADDAGQTSWIVVSAMLCSSTNDPAVCYAASGGNASGYNLVHPNMSYANSGSGGGGGGSGCGSVALLGHHHHDYGYPRPEVTGSGPFVQDLDCSIHSSAVAAVAAAAAAAAISTYHQQHPANPGSSAVSSSAIHPPKKFWDHPAQGTHPPAKKSDSAGAKSSQNNRNNGRPSRSSAASSSKKRKRVATVAQRRAANIRERRRMFNLNEAFDKLRRKVPTFAYEKRLSRIETLRLAITYISFMDQVIRSEAKPSASSSMAVPSAAIHHAGNISDDVENNYRESTSW